jgi:hypothetical protein
LADSYQVSLPQPAAWGVNDYSTQPFTIPSGELFIFSWAVEFNPYNAGGNTRPEYLFTYEVRATNSATNITTLLDSVPVATGAFGGNLQAHGTLTLSTASGLNPNTYISWGTAATGGSQRFSWVDARLVVNFFRVTSFIGLNGTISTTGAIGETGATGPRGSTGSQGATGATGTTGATGAQGIQGIQGATGATGPQGIQGATGATGAAGTSGNSPNTTYTISELSTNSLSTSLSLGVPTPLTTYITTSTIQLITNTNDTQNVRTISYLIDPTSGSPINGRLLIIQYRSLNPNSQGSALDIVSDYNLSPTTYPNYGFFLPQPTGIYMNVTLRLLSGQSATFIYMTNYQQRQYSTPTQPPRVGGWLLLNTTGVFM